MLNSHCHRILTLRLNVSLKLRIHARQKDTLYRKLRPLHLIAPFLSTTVPETRSCVPRDFRQAETPTSFTLHFSFLVFHPSPLIKDLCRKP